MIVLTSRVVRNKSCRQDLIYPINISNRYIANILYWFVCLTPWCSKSPDQTSCMQDTTSKAHFRAAAIAYCHMQPTLQHREHCQFGGPGGEEELCVRCRLEELLQMMSQSQSKVEMEMDVFDWVRNRAMMWGPTMLLASLHSLQHLSNLMHYLCKCTLLVWYGVTAVRLFQGCVLWPVSSARHYHAYFQHSSVLKLLNLEKSKKLRSLLGIQTAE